MANYGLRTQPYSWVACGPNGHYHEACMSLGYAKPNEYLVVDWELWCNWYFEQRYTSDFIQPPRPVFHGLNYDVAVKVAQELSNEATHIELRNEIQYAINQQDAPMIREG